MEKIAYDVKTIHICHYSKFIRIYRVWLENNKTRFYFNN